MDEMTNTTRRLTSSSQPYVETRDAVEADTTAPTQDSRGWHDRLATPKQMNWVRQLPDGEREAQERFGVPVERLTKRQAYELIREGGDMRSGSHV